MPRYTYQTMTHEFQLRASGGDLLHCLLDDGAFPENQAFRWSLRDVDCIVHPHHFGMVWLSAAAGIGGQKLVV